MYSMQTQLEAVLTEEQAELRKNGNTIDPINRTKITEHYVEDNINIFSIFIDFKIVFNRAWQKALCYVRRSHYFPVHLVDAIEKSL